MIVIVDLPSSLRIGRAPRPPAFREHTDRDHSRTRPEHDPHPRFRRQLTTRDEDLSPARAEPPGPVRHRRSAQRRETSEPASVARHRGNCPRPRGFGRGPGPTAALSAPGFEERWPSPSPWGPACRLCSRAWPGWPRRRSRRRRNQTPAPTGSESRDETHPRRPTSESSGPSFFAQSRACRLA